MEAPQRIELSGGERLVLTWDDGTVASLDVGLLRRRCPCAGCKVDPVPGRNLLAGLDPIRISDVRLVGEYALGLTFTPDDHGAGIYSFSYLRGLRDGA